MTALVADVAAPAATSARLVGITKTFGGIRALDHVDFDARAGEIHALVGHNGAGKSTLVKCLTGAHPPDEGEIFVHDRKVAFRSPADASDAGIGVVYQELSLFPSLSVGENVLGRNALGSPWIAWGSVFRVARDHLRAVGLEVDPRTPLSHLPLGEQQLVEIARALFSGADVIVLDEPTSALSPAERDLLFATLHRLKAEGRSFILVTHILEEVIGNADRVTVLRNGRRVTTRDARTTTKGELVDLMLGTEAQVLRATYEGDIVTLPPASTDPAILEIRDLETHPAVRGVSLDVRRGEIVGIYGDLGSGGFDLAATVFGLIPPAHGTIAIDGDTTATRTPTRARDSGVAYLSEDRRRALALSQSVSRNVTLAALHRIERFFLDPARENRLTSGLIDELRIANATPQRDVGALSGGNQQKVVLARWLVQPPRVICLVEPTRGMDVGAKSEVIRIVQKLKKQDVAVLVVSTEPETVLAMAERVLVMHRGRITAEYSDCRVDKRTLVEAGS
jgi:ribose transport system ATP-binding protein